MSERRASLEVIAPSIEEAIANGLGELGLKQNDVIVEVLDEGSKGLFGLGSRQARVRLTIKALSAHELAAEPEVEGLPEPAADEQVEESLEDFKAFEPDKDDFEAELEETEELGEARDLVLHVARETVMELIERMGIDAEISAHFGEAGEARGRTPVLVNVNGKDLSILIGPQAETLNALQYIAGLIISKELGRSIPLVVDVEGYRVRRAQAIRRLARSMADQAIKTGRRQALEPMPASERRLVHIELRDDPQVYTESSGEDPRRKVVIIPKEVE
jgi:spoIIIJ-associated protein